MKWISSMLKSMFVPYHGEFRGYRLLLAVQAVFLIGLWVAHPGADLPSLPQIGTAWAHLASTQGLLHKLSTSVLTIWKALLLSSVISLVIAYLSTAIFFKPASHLAASFRFLGFAGLTFLFTLWSSGAAELKLYLLTFGMTVFLVTNMLAEVDATTRENVDYAKTLGLTGWRITLEQVVLGKAHTMLDLIRQNAAIGWTILSMVEGIARSEGGIGALLINQNRHFNLSAIFAVQLTILVYGLIQDFALAWIRSVLCPYARLLTSRS